MRAECARTPSVPFSWMRNRQRAQQAAKDAKKMAAGNTRRIRTEQRISANIMKHNTPCESNNFQDILVSHSASAGVLQSSFKATKAVKMASTGNQADASTMGEDGVKMQRDAMIGQSNNYLQSQVSDPIDGIIKQNTFSMFDQQSSFDKQITLPRQQPNSGVPRNMSNKKSPTYIGKESSEDKASLRQLKPGNVRVAARGNDMRRSDELSLKTVQHGAEAVTDKAESPLKLNIYNQQSTLKWTGMVPGQQANTSPDHKQGGGDNTQSPAKVQVNNF